MVIFLGLDWCVMKDAQIPLQDSNEGVAVLANS